MAKTKIEWTETTWNPVTGCDKVSPGCKHCYAERMSARLKGMGSPNYANGFELTLHPHMLGHPLLWRKPSKVFVNSMSDLFHREVPVEYIQQVFEVMRQTPQHEYQVLTKRAERLAGVSGQLDWPDNVSMGVTVENADYLHRIDYLRQTGAKTKFLSIEPLLGPMAGLDLTGINWVIVGGESGPGARPMNPEWVRVIRDKCIESGVPFFFKQWGGVSKKKAGRILDGRTWDERPGGAYQYNG